MPPDQQSTERDSGIRALLDESLVAIEKAVRGSNTIWVTAEARRLLRAHPSSQMSLVEIEAELMRLVVQRGVAPELPKRSGT
jgi:hypothetical protein